MGGSVLSLDIYPIREPKIIRRRSPLLHNVSDGKPKCQECEQKNSYSELDAFASIVLWHCGLGLREILK
jgi:hypothetical protein